MKKLFMLLAVVAMTATYALAQNANSGVTVSKNGNEFWLIDDCGTPFFASNSNSVTKANGFIKWTGTFDVSASVCTPLPNKTERQNFIVPNTGWEVTIVVTPSGQATLKVMYKPNKS